MVISGFLILTGHVTAQVPDSAAGALTDSLAGSESDSLGQSSVTPVNSLADSVSGKPVTEETGWQLQPGSNRYIGQQVLEHHPYFGFGSPLRKPFPEAIRKKSGGKEWIFYLLVFMLIVYATLRRLFPKYFSDLFRLFFRTTIKQRQIKEQLVQTPLPSLLLNVFYVLSGGLYITFILEYFNIDPAGNFWMLLLYCMAGLSGIYFVKFAGLKLSGWVFGIEETADAYIFIVFVVNKMLGILILPFLVLIAFTTGEIFTVGMALSWCLVGGLFIYRFILTFAAVRNQVKLNPFHFFLYLCAFELAPLLLIYKGLLLFLGINT